MKKVIFLLLAGSLCFSSCQQAGNSWSEAKKYADTTIQIPCGGSISMKLSKGDTIIVHDENNDIVKIRCRMKIHFSHTNNSGTTIQDGTGDPTQKEKYAIGNNNTTVLIDCNPADPGNNCPVRIRTK